MKKAILCVVLAVVIFAVPVLAASYTGQISIVESNGTSYAMLPMVVDADVTEMIAQGYITASGLDTAIGSSPHMVADDKVLFAAPVSGNMAATTNFSTGNAPLANFYIIVGYGGYFTVTDNLAMEGAVGQSWEDEIKGYFDTTSPTSILTRVGGNGNITISAPGNIHIDFPAWGKTLDAPGVTSGITTIKLSCNGVNGTKLYINGVEVDSDAQNTYPIAADGDWAAMSGACNGYWEYWKHSINGALVSSYQPETLISGTTLPDLEGTAQNGTITWGTNPAGVTSALITFGPTSQAQPDSFSLVGAGEILTGAPAAIPQMYTDLTDDGFDKIPGAEGVNRLLDEGEVPQAMWWYPVVYFGLGIFALMIYGLTSNVMQRGVIQSGGQDGSLMLMCIFIEVGFVVFGIMGITVFWPAILFPVPALALLTSTKHYSVG